MRRESTGILFQLWAFGHIQRGTKVIIKTRRMRWILHLTPCILAFLPYLGSPAIFLKPWQELFQTSLVTNTWEHEREIKSCLIVHHFAQKDKNAWTSHRLSLTRAFKTCVLIILTECQRMPWKTFQNTVLYSGQIEILKYYCSGEWDHHKVKIPNNPISNIGSLAKDLFSSVSLFMYLYTASNNLLKPPLVSPKVALAKSLPHRKCLSQHIVQCRALLYIPPTH